MLIGARKASIGGIATLTAGVLLALTPAAFASGGAFMTAPDSATTMNREQAGDYWTPERIAGARELDVQGDGDEAGAVTTAEVDPARVTGSAMKSVWVRKTRKYPNRVHGKLVGTYQGLGNFACSATVVSSNSGALVTTAGHCAVDAGGSHQFATNLAFIPGFARNKLPYGVWNVKHVIVPRAWGAHAAFNFDAAMLRVQTSPYGSLQSIVGSRGIGFNQSRKQHLSAYGYPARGKPAYNGYKLIRCDSKQSKDPAGGAGPRSRGIKCDMKQGSSGGGWVAQKSFVVSNGSHIYSRRGHGKEFGPYYGQTIKRMYAAKVNGWPSIGPVRCNGRVATIVGTNRAERLRGSGGRDVIAALGGNDKVRGANGDDIICGGSGKDKLAGNGGRDRLEGGKGPDRCKGGGGRNATKGCRFGV